MIWNDKRLTQWAENGGVEPFDPKLINPASIDLKIGSFIRVPIEDNTWSDPIDMNITPWTIKCGEIVLLHTLEFTKIPTNAIAMLFLKSTVGRQGLEHLHAGYGDPGFHGQWTLEIINHWPFPRFLVPGLRLIQLVLADAEEAGVDYSKTGHYQNQLGPTVPWR